MFTRSLLYEQITHDSFVFSFIFLLIIGDETPKKEKDDRSDTAPCRPHAITAATDNVVSVSSNKSIFYSGGKEIYYKRVFLISPIHLKRAIMSETLLVKH